jgi:site-specific DNA-cytosine methylase
MKSKQLSYGSVCSGIESASVAWEPLGWRPAWFAEIEPFPSAVLAHRFPQSNEPWRHDGYRVARS